MHIKTFNNSYHGNGFVGIYLTQRRLYGDDFLLSVIGSYPSLNFFKGGFMLLITTDSEHRSKEYLL